MRIATNIPALQARSSLTKSSNAATLASGKLSSGLRINSAADDSAGMAISARMKMQIRGSARANQNTLDGISLVQTADGAMQEVHDMLQRMRELTIQAANSTNTQSDLKHIQTEIDELKEEIDSISEKSEFNKIKLFDGKSDSHVMGINAKAISIAGDVVNGDYKFDIIELGTKTLYTMGSALNSEIKFPSDQLRGTITMNEKTVEIFSADTLLDAQKKLINLAKECGFVATRSDDGASIASIEAEKAGSKQTLDISCDSNLLLDVLGINANATFTQGTDAVIKLVRNSKDSTSVISDSATYISDGNKITILDINNQRIVSEIGITTKVERPIVGYISELQGKILDRWNIVDKTYDDIQALNNKLYSLTNKADAYDMAEELLRLEELTINTSSEAKDLMREAVSAFPELKDLPTYGPELGNLDFHDGHYISYFNTSNSYIQSAMSKATSDGDNLSSIISDLSYAFSNGTGYKSGGSGVAGCSFEIVNSARNIVQNTEQEIVDDEVKTAIINVSDGGLILQVGANENMQMKLNISKVTAQTLEIDDLDISTYDKAQQAIIKLDYAIERISANRAMLGSYQNRLDYTKLNLSSIEFNLTKSLSVIQDADLAYEMAEATRNNVLQQAGMFILSQANQKPQELLQLLK